MERGNPTSSQEVALLTLRPLRKRGILGSAWQLARHCHQIGVEVASPQAFPWCKRPGRFRLPDGTDHRMCDVKPTRSVRRRLPHCPAGQLFLHRLRSKGTRSLNRCQEVVELSATCRFIPPMKSGGFHGLISVKRRSVRRSHNINARLRERSYATSEKRPS